MIPLGIGQNLNYVVFFHVYKYMYLCYSCQNGLFYLWCMIVMNINFLLQDVFVLRSHHTVPVILRRKFSPRMICPREILSDTFRGRLKFFMNLYEFNF